MGNTGVVCVTIIGPEVAVMIPLAILVGTKTVFIAEFEEDLIVDNCLLPEALRLSEREAHATVEFDTQILLAAFRVFTGQMSAMRCPPGKRAIHTHQRRCRDAYP